MGWVIAAASGVAATVGVAGLALGMAGAGDAGAGGAVWIDGPLAGARVVPGEVTVSAHASAATRIDDLVLEVDGEQIAEAADVERNGRLVFATFAWEAPAGQHTLVVVRDGDEDVRSAERLVYVDVPGEPAPSPSASPTPSASPSATSSPSASETPTATVSTASASPSASATTPEPSAPATRPTRKPSPTRTPTPSAPKPTLDRAGMSSVSGDLKVYQVTGCPYVVTVTALTTNATRVRAIVSGTGRSFALADAGGGAWSGSITSGYDAGQVGDHTVTLEATGPGGTVSRSAGTLSILPSCPKD